MSADIASLVSDNLDIWTSAVARKSGAGRGGNKRPGFYGIEQLRKLIAELAVRGRLVPQNAEDQSAAELLKTIDRSRVQLIEAGFIRGAKANLKPELADSPFDIPASWQWVRLERLGAIVGGGTPSAHDSANFATAGQGTPWLTPADLSGFVEQYVSVGQRDLTAKGLKSSSAKVMPAGTVLFTSRAPIGYVAIAANPIATNQGFKSVVPAVDGMSEYIALTLKTFAKKIDADAPGTTFKEVSGKLVGAVPFPLPPLAEQQRIVTKVDELLALCDALEAQSVSAIEAHQALVEALLATLVMSSNNDELAAKWARLENHFDALFMTETSVDTFKKTILELAVRGLLGTQNRDDAEIDLPSFREVSKSSEWDERVFTYGSNLLTLPRKWKFAPLAQIASHVVDCPHTTPKWTDAGELCVRTNQIKPRHLDLSDPNYVSSETYIERIERLRPEPGDILYIREGGILGVGCRIPEGVKLCLGQRSMLIRCTPVIASRYLEAVLNSPFVIGLAQHFTTGGAAPRVNMSTVRGYSIPVPPLPEQNRIVAKIDELTALCDALRSRIIDAAQTQKNLADTIVERAAA